MAKFYLESGRYKRVVGCTEDELVGVIRGLLEDVDVRLLSNQIIASERGYPSDRLDNPVYDNFYIEMPDEKVFNVADFLAESYE